MAKRLQQLGTVANSRESELGTRVDSVLDAGIGVLRRPGRQSSELRPATRAAPASLQSEVDHDAPRVGHGHLHAAHALPAPRDPQQTLLDEILRLRVIPGDQACGTEQLADVSVDEPLE